MITKRRFRRTVWFLVIAASLASVVLFEIEDRAGGAVQLRSLSRAEIRAPLDAFLKQVSYSEGDHVSAGSIVAQLEVSDLDSRIAQKKAEICEAKAELRALEIGPRPEEIVEQRLRVQRLTGWRDLALTQLPRRAQQASAVRDSILGLDAEAEVARREKDLADAQGNLELLEAGTRPEDLDAARAHLRRLTEELQYLQSVKARQVVATPISGQIATKHLPEKVGQYFREGDLICLVEDANRLEVLIAVPEQDIARVMPGQRVELKLRAFPFDTLDTVVERIAPVTDRGESDTAPQTELAGTITVSCQLLEPRLHLRAGMTGHARIFTGRRPIGEILLDRGLRLIRTEFWW